MEILLQSWRPNDQLRAALESNLPSPAPASVRYGDEQRVFQAAMLAIHPFIVAAALRGLPSKVIAASFGVSREAVDRQLRPLGLKNPPGVRGRPRQVVPAGKNPIVISRSSAGEPLNTTATQRTRILQPNKLSGTRCSSLPNTSPRHLPAERPSSVSA